MHVPSISWIAARSRRTKTCMYKHVRWALRRDHIFFIQLIAKALILKLIFRSFPLRNSLLWNALYVIRRECIYKRYKILNVHCQQGRVY